MVKEFQDIPKEVELIAKQTIDCAFKVHKALGPGLLENVYEICFCHELKKHGLSFQRQVQVPVRYDNIYFDIGFRLDVMVEDKIICELKSVIELIPVFDAQVLSHMKLTGKRLGFLINFNVPVIKKGIKRFVI